MTVATVEAFCDLLGRTADLSREFDIPEDERQRRWLLGSVQVAQLELAGLEARLARDPLNGTPRPKTPAKPPPTKPQQQPKHQPKNDPPPNKGGRR